MDVSVIIVNWNSREDLKRCIASIRMHTRDIEYEIVVIDSGSNDGCDQMLRENYPDVRFVQSATNLGFARANNRAFEEATGENLLFLNPDTELTGPAITRLRSHLHSHPNAGIVGCRLLNSDGTLQSSCIQSIPTIWNQLLNSQFLRTRWPKSGLWGMAPLFQQGIAPREVEAISGACLMVRRHTFQQVNGFSEEYFMYAEDDRSRIQDSKRRIYELLPSRRHSDTPRWKQLPAGWEHVLSGHDAGGDMAILAEDPRRRIRLCIPSGHVCVGPGPPAPDWTVTIVLDRCAAEHVQAWLRTKVARRPAMGRQPGRYRQRALSGGALT